MADRLVQLPERLMERIEPTVAVRKNVQYPISNAFIPEKRKPGRPVGTTKKNINKKGDTSREAMKWAVKKIHGNEKEFYKAWLKDDPRTFRKEYVTAIIPKQTEMQGDINISVSWLGTDGTGNGPI